MNCNGCHSGFIILGSGYEAGFDAGYPKGYADGLDEGSADPRVERIEAGFKAMHAATNGEYSREDLIVMDALQSGRDCAVRQARIDKLVSALQAHAREHGWQDVDEPIAALLAWQPVEEAVPQPEIAQLERELAEWKQIAEATTHAYETAEAGRNLLADRLEAQPVIAREWFEKGFEAGYLHDRPGSRISLWSDKLKAQLDAAYLAARRLLREDNDK